MDDLLAWHYDKKGVFSVKSEYHVLADEQKREARKQTGEGSSALGQSPDAGFGWHKIWELKCPPKVKHFFLEIYTQQPPSQKKHLQTRDGD